jgi:hypothetical protein
VAHSLTVVIAQADDARYALASDPDPDAVAAAVLTLVASVAPSRRATKVVPVAALAVE